MQVKIIIQKRILKKKTKKKTKKTRILPKISLVPCWNNFISANRREETKLDFQFLLVVIKLLIKKTKIVLMKFLFRCFLVFKSVPKGNTKIKLLYFINIMNVLLFQSMDFSPFNQSWRPKIKFEILLKCIQMLHSSAENLAIKFRL